MNACVFAGPTLSADEIAEVCTVEVLPPASMGDVIGAVENGFTKIGIIDGFFDGQPSVWHKEILWAIDQGVTVLGAASIGALRAAELSPFGMIGVGEIFNAFMDGRMEDDDEVALVHGPRELGYPSLSEPMVNIRHTLAKAVDSGVIDRDLEAKLTEFAKALHFVERTWTRLLDYGARFPKSALAVERLSPWLALNYVDLKKRDALMLLEVMFDEHVTKEPSFRFEWTVMWDKALTQKKGSSDEEINTGVIDELRLSPGLFANVRRRALARFLASHRRSSQKAADSSQALPALLKGLRRDHGLLLRSQLDDWLAENALDPGGLERLLETEAAMVAAEQNAGPALDIAMIDEVRRIGSFSALSARAIAKREALGHAEVKGRNGALPGGALLIEWFVENSDISLPRDDPDALAEALAMPDRLALHRLIADEFQFRKWKEKEDKV